MFERSKLGRVSVSVALFAIAYLALCIVYLCWTWSHELGDFGGDNAFYLLMAEHFSPWTAYSPVTEYFASHNPYPPLYPLLLGFFTDGGNLLAAHLVTTAFLLVSFALLVAWQRELGIGGMVAAWVVVLFALLRGTYMQALALLSENLYLLCTLVALLAVAYSERTGKDSWRWVATAAVAAAMLTRMAGLSLFIAFAAYLVLHRVRRGWLMAGVALIPLTWWSVVFQTNGSVYSSTFLERYGAESFQVVVRQITHQAGALWYGWLLNFSNSISAGWVIGAAAIICLAGALDRVLTRKFDGLYVVTYLLMVLVWPHPSEAQRLIFVLVPVLLVQGVWWLSRTSLLHMKWRGVRIAPPVLLLILTLVAIPELVLTVGRFYQPLPRELEVYRRDVGWYGVGMQQGLESIAFSNAVLLNLQQARDRLPEEACLYSVKPSIAGFYSRRISKIPPPEHLDAAEFRQQLQSSGCRYFHMISRVTPAYKASFYPEQRLEDELRMLTEAKVRVGNREEPVARLAEFVNHGAKLR